jgi:hypothetical protein
VIWVTSDAHGAAGFHGHEHRARVWTIVGARTTDDVAVRRGLVWHRDLGVEGQRQFKLMIAATSQPVVRKVQRNLRPRGDDDACAV